VKPAWTLIFLLLLALVCIRVGELSGARSRAISIDPPMVCPAGANCVAELPDGRRCWLIQHGRRASAHPEWVCESKDDDE
jgi:hypothetical protein